MRRFVLSLLLLLPGLALGAEPKAAVAGPKVATAGALFFLDVSDSVSDPDTPLTVSFGESENKPAAKLLMDDGKPSIVRVLATEPGVYYAVVIARGKLAPDSEVSTKIAVWPITVKPLEPAPTPTPNPTPGPNPPLPGPQSIGEQLGRSFGPKLAASLADAFDTAATMIAAGTSVKEADEALKAKFQSNRWAAFASLAGPTFDAVVPANQEPKDAATRAAFAELHREFAKGLRGAQ